MSVIDKLLPENATKIPGVVDERLKRGKKERDKRREKRKEAYAFARGEQFKYLDSKGALASLPTSTSSWERTGKQPHRFRLVRNLLFDIVEREVSAATSRVPSYEISPSTTDPEDVGASKLAEKVALYGYDKWHVRDVTEKIVRHAIVADEGFAWPYFDNSIGPYIQDAEGSIGQGEIRIRTYGRNQVSWEPGVQFEDSQWHYVESSQEIGRVLEMDGYIGGILKADAEGDGKLVIVGEYLERPTPVFPNGRWLTLANGKVIVGQRAYPCSDDQDETVDEPVLHKLSYAIDAETGQGNGLVPQLVDLQRVINDLPNRELEWVRLALNPQLFIQNGGLSGNQRMTDEPGAVYRIEGSGAITWRPVPQIPAELQNIKADAISDMGRIAGQNDIPNGVEAGRAISALIERDASRRGNFTANLADFHSRLMRHCLYLVQKHYSEERLVRIRGRFGPENIGDFLGAQLRGQVDVTVDPGSIEQRTRQMVEQRVLAYADRGWITPEQAMSSIDNGTAETVIESYELDVARANLLIQKIRDGSIFDMAPRAPFPGEQIPETGPDGQPIVVGMNPDGSPQYQMATEIPGWMPRPFDQVTVQKDQFADWMKTVEYTDQASDQQQAANQIYAGYLKVEADQQAQAQAAQMQTAQAMGDANAARPTQKGMPSQPSGEVFQPRYQTGGSAPF